MRTIQDAKRALADPKTTRETVMGWGVMPDDPDESRSRVSATADMKFEKAVGAYIPYDGRMPSCGDPTGVVTQGPFEVVKVKKIGNQTNVCYLTDDQYEQWRDECRRGQSIGSTVGAEIKLFAEAVNKTSRLLPSSPFSVLLMLDAVIDSSTGSHLDDAIVTRLRAAIRQTVADARHSGSDSALKQALSRHRKAQLLPARYHGVTDN